MRTLPRCLLRALPGLLIALGGQAACGQDSVDALQEKAVQAALEHIAPYVVQIETSGGTEIIRVPGQRGMIRRGFGPTSGLIVGEDGYIISSAFNFANKPSTIRVSVPGHENRYVAKVVGSDETRMLTLLKIDTEGKKLPVPTAAPKKELRIGHTVLAVGRTFGTGADQPPSVSVGIISALERIWGKAVQTDAKVSPTNYGGPLLDLRGRVVGVLVPASPRAEGETAGFEWYDSGIGFAIPLEDINRVLPRLQKGENLKRGVLGITMKGSDIYGAAVEVQTVSAGSGAEKAGLQPEDVILAVDGEAVRNQAQLRHQLGGKYEGEAVSVKVKRGDKEMTIDKVVLGGAVAEFGAAFLGILPVRDDPEQGVEVRHVYAKSPAEKAGLKAGDRVMKVGRELAPGRTVMQAVAGRDRLMALLQGARPDQEVKVEVKRADGKKTETLTVKLGTVPEEVPGELPEKRSAGKALTKPKAPMKEEKKEEGEKKEGEKKEEPEKKEEAEKKDEGEKAETGFLKRTTAAADHTYWMYVPENYDPNVAHALVIWLHPVGRSKERDFEDLALSWRFDCEDSHLILLCPRTENERGWTPSESDFIREAVENVMGNYTIDKQRVVAHGMGLGGEMGYYLGFHARGTIRGVATVGAPMTSNPRERVANQPLAFFLAAGGKDPLMEAIKSSADKLREHKYPVIYREIPDIGHQYIDGRASLKAFEELVRWIDSLDRI